MARRRRRISTPGVLTLVAVAVVGGLALSGHLGSGDSQPATTVGTSGATSTPDPSLSAQPAFAQPAPVAAAAARTALASLTTHPWATAAGYDRVGKFGEAWEDVDRNGCDTRNDVLARDLTSVVRGSNCKVRTGLLVSPYDGRGISFVSGPSTSPLVQIDHVVALADAWRTGAQQLTQSQRVALANDPLELLAVDGASNDEKGSQDASYWLPPNTGYRCAYVTRQIQVKAKYRLWVTSGERAAMTRVLSGCP